MASTSTPATFSELYTDVLNRARSDTGTTSTNYAKRYVNMANHDLHIQQNWPWAERRTFLQTHGDYATGTVSIALATRTTVTGDSTLWNTAVTGMGFNNARAGGKMTFAGATDVYTVSSVSDDTTITLTDRWVGDTALSAESYSYFEDEAALASDFWRLIDARIFSGDFGIEVIPRQDFYRRYPRNSTLGRPTTCTLLELGPSGSVSGRPRVLLHPAPDQVYNIPYRYITTSLAVSSAGAGQSDLSADTDEPIVPLRYRHVLVLYALSIFLRDVKHDTEGAQLAAGEYADLVKRMANDTIPERDHPVLLPSKSRYLVGTAGPRVRSPRRYQTGTEFDEFRA